MYNLLNIYKLVITVKIQNILKNIFSICIHKDDELAKYGVKRNPSVPKRAVVIWIYTAPSGRSTSHKNSRYFVNPQLICPRNYLMKIIVKAKEKLQLNSRNITKRVLRKRVFSSLTENLISNTMASIYKKQYKIKNCNN